MNHMKQEWKVGLQSSATKHAYYLLSSHLISTVTVDDRRHILRYWLEGLDFKDHSAFLRGTHKFWEVDGNEIFIKLY